MKINKSKLFFALKTLLILTICFNFLSVVYSQKEKYQSANYWSRYKALKQTYLDSQYVNKNPPHGWVPDETVLSYAGGALIKGANPILIIPDSPPLSKYFIGISILLFNNEHIVILFFASGSLLLLYFLSQQVFSNKLLALLPSFFFSFEPIFKAQLIYTPLLDIMQLFFLLAIFIVFNNAFKAKNYFLQFVLLSIFLGMYVSTKFFITGFIIIAAWFFLLLVRKDKSRFLVSIVILPISVLILLLSYVRTLAYGTSILGLLGIQKWIFLYHKSQLILPLSIWPLLLLNKWFVWFGDKKIASSVDWTISWPIITMLSIITTAIYIMRKIKRNAAIEIIMAWMVFYVGFFSIGQISPRYFVILIPIFYIISIFGLREFFTKYAHAKK